MLLKILCYHVYYYHVFIYFASQLKFREDNSGEVIDMDIQSQTRTTYK